jgi:predicted XRE-type DNA-binding protein
MEDQQVTTLNIDQPDVNPDPTIGSVQPVAYEGSLQNLIDPLLAKYPEDEKKEEVKEEVKEDEPAESDKDTKTEEKAEDAKEEDEPKEESAEEDLYDASEVEDDEPPAVEDLPKTVEQYIADRLPVVNVTIMVDEKPQVIQVKIPSQLPPNVEFASKNDEVNFNAAMAEQVNNAERLKTEYNQVLQQNQVAQFQRAERLEIKQDIAELQKDGLIPKFTRGQSVENDPRAELAREVLKFYEDENARRIDRANREGRPFSRITFKDAFTIYSQTHPTAKPENKELAKEDEQRKEKVKETAKVNKGQGENAGDGKKEPLPQTRTLNELVRFLA